MIYPADGNIASLAAGRIRVGANMARSPRTSPSRATNRRDGTRIRGGLTPPAASSARRARHQSPEPTSISAMVRVSGSGIAEGGGDVVPVGDNTSGPVAAGGEGTVDVDVDEEGRGRGRGGDELLRLECRAGTRSWRSTCWRQHRLQRPADPRVVMINRGGSNDCRHIKYSTFMFDVGSALSSA